MDFKSFLKNKFQIVAMCVLVLLIVSSILKFGIIYKFCSMAPSELRAKIHFAWRYSPEGLYDAIYNPIV